MMKSDNILICSLETDDKVLRNNYCIKSANHYGIRLEVFGGNVEWDGFFTKVKILNAELNRLKDKYDLVMFVDLRDTMFWADKETILKRLEKINHFGQYRMVFNAETNCFPYDDFEQPMRDLETNNKYCFLNSGMFIGEIDFVSHCLSAIEKNYNNKPSEISDDVWNDDQFHWQSLYLNSPNDISIDSHNELFQAIWDVDGGRTANFDLIINEDYIYNQNTKSYPLLFHSPGPTGTLSQFEKLLDSR